MGAEAPGLAPAERARLRHELEQHGRVRHMGRAGFDAAEIVAAVDARLRAGAPRAEIRKLISKAIEEQTLAWMPRGPVPTAGFKYRVPFDPSVPTFVGQGNGGELSHADPENFFAFDFAMKRGSQVHAARRGRVVSVIDGFREEGVPFEEAWKANVVTVLHPDGTFANYAHLSPGIPVEPGQKLRAGDLIGRSGNTGFSAGPHLHFSVSRADEQGRVESLPIRFRDGTPEGRVPETGEFVLGRRPGNVRLRVRSGEDRLRERVPLAVSVGEQRRFSVEAQLGAGGWQDVTYDPRVRILAATPWLVDVNEFGRARFGRDPEWPDYPFPDATVAYVTVIFQDLEARRIGYFDAMFELPVGQDTSILEEGPP